MQHEYVMIDRSEGGATKLTLRVDDHTYTIHLRLTGKVTAEYQGTLTNKLVNANCTSPQVS